MASMANDDNQAVREAAVYETTRSLCPVCRRVIDADVFIYDNAVYLMKHCPEHGDQEALIASDATWFRNARRYDKPGATPRLYAREATHGCPDDCGLCPEHRQHTCAAVIEITNRCNLRCPVCFADAGEGFDLSLTQINAMLDQLVATEGNPEMVQFSGGEPTLHPDIVACVAAARERGVGHVMINTNGIRLAEDIEFVRQLAAHDPVIYLQFDSLKDSVYRQLRDADLIALKRQALDNIARVGLHATLVPTLVRGVNDDEIGEILNFALEHPAVLGVNYQPVTYSGRCGTDRNPLQRITLTEVLERLETQSGGTFRVSDFRPVPCPHPNCSACTYAVVQDGKVTPITRLVDADLYLDYISNRTLPHLSPELQPVMEALWSMAAVAGGEKTTAALNCVACNLPLSGTGLKPQDFFVVQVHAFMDEHTFDINRLQKCCVHQITPNGRSIPFCAYNNLGYREQVQRELLPGDAIIKP